MRTRWLWVILGVVGLAGVAWAADGGTPLSRGDRAYARFDYTAALDAYRQARDQLSADYETAWKLSRAYIDVGNTVDPKKERRALYEKAEAAARAAVAANPEGAKGHLYLSMALGKVALGAGAKERVKLSKDVKAEVDLALALDDSDDVAWHVLGRWHRRLSTLSWIEKKFADLFLGGVPKEASLENAADCFRRAIELDPGHLNHHLELAITLEKMGNKAGAVVEYRKVEALAPVEPPDAKRKATASERLKKLAG